MNNFDRFLAGDDALSRLIRQQTAFEPTAEQEARLRSVLALIPQTSELALDFEPPQRMEQDFLNTLHSVQQAQTPRRHALLERLQGGESAEALLGHPISGSTQAWLAAQICEPVKPAPVPQNKTPWWQLGSMVLASALVAAMGVQIFFPAKRVADTPLAQTALTDSQPIAPTPLTLQLTPILSKTAPETEHPQDVPATARVAKQLPPAKKIATIADQSAASQTAEQTTRPQHIARELAMHSARQRTAMAERLTPHPSAPALAMQEMAAAPAPMTMKMAAPLTPAAATPSVLITTASSPANVASKQAQPALQIRLYKLSDDPQIIARALQQDWRGEPLILRVADPHTHAAQDWIKKLRAALPNHAALKVQSDPDMDTQAVRLEMSH